jgi:hypothetical protein
VEVEVGGEWSSGVVMREASPSNPLILIHPRVGKVFADGRSSLELDSRKEEDMRRIRREGSGRGHYLRLRTA